MNRRWKRRTKTGGSIKGNCTLPAISHMSVYSRTALPLMSTIVGQVNKSITYSLLKNVAAKHQH